MFHFIVGIPSEIVLKVHHQNTKWNSLYNFRHLFESDFIGTELGMDGSNVENMRKHV